MVDKHAYYWVDFFRSCTKTCRGREGFSCRRLSLFGLEISYAFCVRWRIFLFDEVRIRDVVWLHLVYLK